MAAFTFFGGVPARLVIDNLGTGVTRADGAESITETDFLVERDRILGDRRRLEDRLTALEPVRRPVAPVETDVVDILPDRLDAGLTGVQWQEVARCLIDGIGFINRTCHAQRFFP